MQLSTFGKHIAPGGQFGYRELTADELLLVGGGDGEGDGGCSASGDCGDSSSDPGGVVVAGLSDTVNAIGQSIAAIGAAAAVAVATDGVSVVIGAAIAVGTALGAITSPGMGGSDAGAGAATTGNPMGDPSPGDSGP
ncbi:hypothetical protein ACFPOE_21340 [Caenimonas terrae]|uniref:Bacteriocin n=1 Tax=Caenimonas terrae TaxID=696074 RepID=A0ABW0NLU0_9BURK